MEIARILRKIGYLLEMNEENDANSIFKVRSYKRAGDVIANLSSNIEDIYSKEGLAGLLKIQSIGKAIAGKIEEYINTGKIQYFENLRSENNINIDEFYRLESIGPKTIKIFYDNLDVKNLSDLEKAAAEGKLRNITGFSQKKEESILKKIQLFKRGRERYLIGEVYPLVKQIEARLSGFDGVRKAIATGSFRRMKETIGDIDYLVVSDDPKSLMDYFQLCRKLTRFSVKDHTRHFYD